jgi:hypothetical protein
MNLRMMYYGKKMATEHTTWNDRMTKMAHNFLDREITDPKLRDLIRPQSKCNDHIGLVRPGGADISFPDRRLLQARFAT